MKKLIFIAIAAFMLSSCTRDNFIFETNYVEPLVFTEYYKVLRHEWQRGDNATHGIHYFVVIEEPELRREIFDFGVMQAFVVGERHGREVIIPLPFSDFLFRDGVRFEEQLTVEFSPGRITFIVKNDHQIFQRPFFDVNEFKVRFLW